MCDRDGGRPPVGDRFRQPDRSLRKVSPELNELVRPTAAPNLARWTPRILGFSGGVGRVTFSTNPERSPT